MIENIPFVSCPHCGESYFTASTLHEIDKIKQDCQKLAVQRSVKVASFV